MNEGSLRILFVLVLMGVATETYACSCSSSVSFERHIQSYEYVFGGTVVNVDTLVIYAENQVDISDIHLKATFQVDEVWKGDVSEEFEVWTRWSGASCGFNEREKRFAVGVKFLIIARDPTAPRANYMDEIYTHLCSRSKRYVAATEEIEILGAAQLPVSIEKNAFSVLIDLALQSYPNPATLQSNIVFEITEPGYTSLRVYDLQGRVIENLIEGFRRPGRYELNWTLAGISSGIYVYRLYHNDAAATKTVAVIQ